MLVATQQLLTHHNLLVRNVVGEESKQHHAQLVLQDMQSFICECKDACVH